MQKRKVLIVDDDPHVLGLVSLFLTQAGYDVRREHRSSHAFETAREYMPDVVILDLNMPGKNGTEVACELRTDEALKHVPIMIFTSEFPTSDTEVRDKMLFVAKPVDSQRLINSVQTLLAKAGPTG